MKKLIITCAMLSIVTTVSFAQAVKSNRANGGANPPAVNHNANSVTAATLAERQAKAYEKQLGLSADQYQTVYAAVLDYFQQDQAARMNGQQPGEGQTMQMRMGRDQKIESVLNDVQAAKYRSMQPNAKNAPSTPASR